MPVNNSTPREVANKQLVAYNNHNIDGFCALFDTNAKLTALPSNEVFASGMDELQQFYTARFLNAELRCEVSTQMDIGDFAIDRETVFGLPDGPIELVALYEVREGKIQNAFFIRQE